MMLINDENRNKFIDIEVMRIRIANHIKMLMKDVDDMKCPPQKHVETIDAILAYQCELDDLNEMVKMPFDVLVVVEKKGEDKYLTMVSPPV